jgi:hypothetical protein
MRSNKNFQPIISYRSAVVMTTTVLKLTAWILIPSGNLPCSKKSGSAFAISSYFSIRNHDHELMAKEIVRNLQVFLLSAAMIYLRTLEHLKEQ